MSEALKQMAIAGLNQPGGQKNVNYAVSYAVPRRAVHRGCW